MICKDKGVKDLFRENLNRKKFDCFYNIVQMNIITKHLFMKINIL